MANDNPITSNQTIIDKALMVLDRFSEAAKTKKAQSGSWLNPEKTDEDINQKRQAIQLQKEEAIARKKALEEKIAKSMTDFQRLRLDLFEVNNEQKDNYAPDAIETAVLAFSQGDLYHNYAAIKDENGNRVFSDEQISVLKTTIPKIQEITDQISDLELDDQFCEKNLKDINVIIPVPDGFSRAEISAINSIINQAATDLDQVRPSIKKTTKGVIETSGATIHIEGILDERFRPFDVRNADFIPNSDDPAKYFAIHGVKNEKKIDFEQLKHYIDADLRAAFVDPEPWKAVNSSKGRGYILHSNPALHGRPEMTAFYVALDLLLDRPRPPENNQSLDWERIYKMPQGYISFTDYTNMELNKPIEKKDDEPLDNPPMCLLMNTDIAKELCAQMGVDIHRIKSAPLRPER